MSCLQVLQNGGIVQVDQGGVVVASSRDPGGMKGLYYIILYYIILYYIILYYIILYVYIIVYEKNMRIFIHIYS